jgi:hypothetical protein
MTELLEKAFAEASKLPEQDQNAMAHWLLSELDSERAWQERFAHSVPVLQDLVKEAMEEHQRGETLELDPDRL